MIILCLSVVPHSFLGMPNKQGFLSLCRYYDFKDHGFRVMSTGGIFSVQSVKKASLFGFVVLMLIAMCSPVHAGEIGFSDSSSNQLSIRKITASRDSSYALDDRGRLWGWGRFSAYSVSKAVTPRVITFFEDKPKIKDIAALGNSLLVLLENGQVWMHSRYWRDAEFKRIDELKGIVNIRAGSGSYSLIDAQGTIWRLNESLDVYKLGSVPDVAEAVDGYVLKKDGTLWRFDHNHDLVRMTGVEDVIHIATGNYAQTNYALTKEGKLYAWGTGKRGNVTLPYLSAANHNFFDIVPVPGIEHVADILTGDKHVLVRKQDGTVWAWGENNLHQLGVRAPESSATPIQIEALHDIVSIYSGVHADHSFAVRQDGTIWAWGNNRNGETGTGISDQDTIPAPRKVIFTPPPQSIADAFSFEYYGLFGNAIHGMAADLQGNVVIARDNELMISHDRGLTWSRRPRPDENGSLAVKKVMDYFYLWSSNSDPHLYFSKDGEEWTEISLKIGDQAVEVKNISAVNHQYMLLGLTEDHREDQTYLFTSQDGVHWQKKGAVQDNISTVIWTGEQYTAVGQGYQYFGETDSLNQFVILPDEPRAAELIVYTSDNLTDWQMRSGSVKSLKYTVRVNGVPSKNYRISLYEEKPDGTFVFADGYGNRLSTKDGIRFELKRLPGMFQEASSLTSMFWNGSEYFMYGLLWRDQVVVYTSKDKEHWTKPSVSEIPEGLKVVQSGDIFIGANQSGWIARSEDGLHWQVMYEGYPDTYIYQVVQADDRYVAVGSQYQYSVPAVVTSEDGERWKEKLLSDRLDTSPQSMRSVAWNGSQFVVVGNNKVWVSKEGTEWSEIRLQDNLSLQKVVWTGKQFVAVGEHYDLKTKQTASSMYTSSDGTHWELIYNTDARIKDIAAAQGKVVAVGTKNNQAVALQSEDMKNWHTESFTLGKDMPFWSRMKHASFDGDLTQCFTNVQWANNRFIIMADRIYTSTDGKQWSVVNGEYADFIYEFPNWYSNGNVLWTGSEYVYYKDRILGFSRDLESWQFYEHNNTYGLKQIIWTGEDLLGVGDSGLIVRIKQSLEADR